MNYKQTAEQEFIEAVEASEAGTVERLPRNCLATFLFKPAGHTEESGIPLKFIVQAVDATAIHFPSKYCGYFVVWLLGDQAILFHNEIYNTSKARISTLQRQIPDNFYKKATLAVELASIARGMVLRTVEDASEQVKYKPVDRSERKGRSTNQLESDGIKEMMEHLPEKSFMLTPETCKADAGFHVGQITECLAVQVKTASLVPGAVTTNKFHNTEGYSGMLLFCRPMPKQPYGTMIMPGDGAPANLAITLKAKCKYMEYMVQDADLAVFLGNLHAAVKRGRKTFTWPSGSHVDISTIKLESFDVLRIPPYKTNQLEQEFWDWRNSLLPSLCFKSPDVQHSSYDAICESLRLQDKVASDVDQRHPVGLRKQDGRDKYGKKKEEPYAVGDFDLLCVFLHCKRFFFLIPATVLAKRGVLATQDCPGKTAIVCYDMLYKKYNVGKASDTWTQAYCFDACDSDVEVKVMAALANYRAELSA